jgi:riboflavin kinase/FMN adenylyltransferase
MQVLESIVDLAEIDGPVHLGIGVFDGVHLGHQAVIRSAIDCAQRMGGSAVAVTFDPHPIKILRPEIAPRLLTSTPHKVRLIAAMDMPFLLKVRFDADFASLAAEDFIVALVKQAQPLRTISVGHDWAFGRGRTGNVAMLKSLGAKTNFSVVEVDPVLLDGDPVSSTRIRRAVQAGEFDIASRCLGRRYSILGTVERGQQLGRTIGFPTANLRAHNEQFPPDGVYAVRTRIGLREVGGVANVGMRPTVETHAAERRLEVHLFDVDEDLYRCDLEVVFEDFLRPEKKFGNLAELQTQIGADAAVARKLLAR